MHTYIQTERQTDRQTGRHTDRHTAPPAILSIVERYSLIIGVPVRVNSVHTWTGNSSVAAYKRVSPARTKRHQPAHHRRKTTNDYRLALLLSEYKT